MSLRDIFTRAKARKERALQSLIGHLSSQTMQAKVWTSRGPQFLQVATLHDPILTNRDLDVLRPHLEKIHEMCRQKDFALHLGGGFDLLMPPFAPDIKRMNLEVSGPFIIRIDTSAAYNHPSNPFSPPLVDVTPVNKTQQRLVVK